MPVHVVQDAALRGERGVRHHHNRGLAEEFSLSFERCESDLDMHPWITSSEISGQPLQGAIATAGDHKTDVVLFQPLHRVSECWRPLLGRNAPKNSTVGG